MAANLASLATDAIQVTPTIQVTGVATHPEDDLVLAAAVSAGEDYLVSGDRQLQALGYFEGVTILSPRAFLAALEAAARSEDDAGTRDEANDDVDEGDGATADAGEETG